MVSYCRTAHCRHLERQRHGLVNRAQIDASSPVVRHGGDSATARWIPCSRAGFPCVNRWDRGKWFVSEIELWSLCYVKLNLFQYSVWPFLFHSSSRYQSVSSRYAAGSPIRQSIDHISRLYGLWIVWPVRCRRTGRLTACDLFVYKYNIHVIYFHT